MEIIVIVFILFGLLFWASCVLSATRERVLQYMLKNRYPLYGLDFIYARVARQGTIYLVLHGLENEGLVHSWSEKRFVDRGPRRAYVLTAVGVAEAEARHRLKDVI